MKGQAARLLLWSIILIGIIAGCSDDPGKSPESPPATSTSAPSPPATSTPTPPGTDTPVPYATSTPTSLATNTTEPTATSNLIGIDCNDSRFTKRILELSEESQNPFAPRILKLYSDVEELERTERVLRCKGTASLSRGGESYITYHYEIDRDGDAFIGYEIGDAISESTLNPASPGLTLDNPVPAGEALQGSDGTEISVLGIVEDARRQVAEENQFNDPPNEGKRFYMITVEVYYPSGSGSVRVSDSDFSLIGENHVVYEPFDYDCGVIPGELGGEIFPGGRIQGNICFEIPEDESGLILIHEPGYGTESRRFIILPYSEAKKSTPATEMTAATATTPKPTVTPTLVPTLTQAPTATPISTLVPSVTPQPAATSSALTPEPTPTQDPTATPTPESTPTQDPTATPTQAPTPTPTQAPTPTPTPEPTPVAIGTTVEVGRSSYTLNEIMDPAPAGILGVTEGKRLVALDITQMGISVNGDSYNLLNFAIQDTDGYLYTPGFADADAGPPFGVGELAAGQIVRGWVVFELPEAARLVSASAAAGVFGARTSIADFPQGQVGALVSQSPPPLPVPPVSPVAIGTTVEVGRSSYTLNEIMDPAPAGILGVTEGKRLVALDITQVGISVNGDSYNLLNFAIQDTDGYLYPPGFADADVGPPFGFGELAAGQIVRGWVVFELPEAARLVSASAAAGVFGARTSIADFPQGQVGALVSQSPPPLPVPPVSPVAIGTTVEVGRSSYTLNEIMDPAPAGILGVTEGKRLVALDITQVGISVNGDSYNLLNFAIQDTDGYLYTPGFADADVGPPFGFGELAAAQIVRGWVVFELPESARLVSALAAAGVFGARTPIADLQQD